MFDSIDVDGNGKITIDEMEKLMIKLNQETTQSQLEAIFKTADKDGRMRFITYDLLHSHSRHIAKGGLEGFSQACLDYVKARQRKFKHTYLNLISQLHLSKCVYLHQNNVKNLENSACSAC